MKLPSKLPDEVLDYTLDFTKWLDVGDTITSATGRIEAGDVVLGTVSRTGTTVTFWLSGGTSGRTCEVIIDAVTTGGRTYAVPCTIVIDQ